MPSNTGISCETRFNDDTRAVPSAGGRIPLGYRVSSAALIEWAPPCDSIGIDVPESPLVKEKEEPMEKHTVVGVDLAKTKFEVAASEDPGRVGRHRRLDRSGFLTFFAQLPAATVVMEACGSAHHWARQIEHLGHRVILLPPHKVRPYVTRNKTDRTDAKGRAEAASARLS